MFRRSTVFAVVALAIAACCGLAGCGGSTTTIVKTTTTSAASGDGSKAGFAEIPTVKCRTIEGVHQPAAQLEPTTLVPLSPSVTKNLAAYRDSAGTMVVAPVGFDCKAGIGVDGSETITAYPKGSSPPVGGKAGTVVDLGIATACQGCIAGTICTFFPEAKPVKTYFGELSELKCPEKPLREKVSYPAPSTALFEDPPKIAGSGLGSGGEEPSYGAISYFEPIGVRKVSCTLPPAEAELCPAIVAATFASVPLRY